MEWNSGAGSVVSPVHARTAAKRFLHLRLGARAPREIGIAADRSEVRGGSSKVVIHVAESSALSRDIIVGRGRME